ncbi:hypothetical protein COP1_023235 [Malus domestica]
MPIQKSKRQAQKSEKHLAFPDALAPVTRKLSFAEITGNLLKRRSQISKRRQSFSASSAPVTRKLSFAEITGTDCLEPFPDCLSSTALEYSSPTVAVLSKKLLHLPEEQIRQVKMIPCSMWRQRAEETSREECSLHSQLSRRSLS